MKVELSEADILYLKDLHEIAIEDDVFDLPAYDSISRGEKISGAWQALKVIERIIKFNPHQEE
jgi:hypothetical protein